MGMAQGVQSLGLLEAGICQHHDLREQASRGPGTDHLQAAGIAVPARTQGNTAPKQGKHALGTTAR